jgi:hypothetical protein
LVTLCHCVIVDLAFRPCSLLSHPVASLSYFSSLPSRPSLILIPALSLPLFSFAPSQVILCSFGAIANYVWMNTNALSNWYLPFALAGDKISISSTAGLSWFTYLVLLDILGSFCVCGFLAFWLSITFNPIRCVISIQFYFLLFLYFFLLVFFRYLCATAAYSIQFFFSFVRSPFLF